MLIGVIVGPAHGGINAVLFYLFAYGIMNTAAFAVLAGLERQGREVESMVDLAGLRLKHGWMAAALSISAASLLGFPPLIGFLGKLYLFIAGVSGGQLALVVIAGINSAISAWYYLALVKSSVMDEPTAQSETVVRRREVWPRVAAIAGSVVILAGPFIAQPLFKAASESSRDDSAANALDDSSENPPISARSE
jgi:NADH-quinone oxidoreductase subunit N